jgi:hypothetical protein
VSLGRGRLIGFAASASDHEDGADRQGVMAPEMITEASGKPTGRADEVGESAGVDRPTGSADDRPQQEVTVPGDHGASLEQRLFAVSGLALGVALPRVSGGPAVEGGKVAQLLFSLGLGVVSVVTIVFSLLFGVVQWSAVD